MLVTSFLNSTQEQLDKSCLAVLAWNQKKEASLSQPWKSQYFGEFLKLHYWEPPAYQVSPEIQELIKDDLVFEESVPGEWEWFVYFIEEDRLVLESEEAYLDALDNEDAWDLTGRLNADGSGFYKDLGESFSTIEEALKIARDFLD